MVNEADHVQFLFKIKVNQNGCWLYQAGRFDTGYGSFWLDGSDRCAHRVSWLIHKGEIPGNLFVCHKCDVKLCVNPDHLFLGTTQENTADRVKKGRCARGRAHLKRVTLTEQEVNEIRYLLSNGAQNYILAEKYKISRATISDIKRRRSWKWLKSCVYSELRYISTG